MSPKMNEGNGSKKEEKTDHSQDMAAMLAHAIRTKVTSAGGLVNMLLDGRGGEMDDRVRRYLTFVTKDLADLAGIMDDYMLASTPDKNCPKELVCFFSDIIAPLLKDFSQELKRKNITVYFQPDETTRGKTFIKVNKPVLKIIIRELLSNAIKHIPINGTIIIDFRKENGMDKFSVFDTGRAISMSKQKLIFNVFESDRSFGIGLSALRKLIERHGGKIWYENSIDKKHPVFYFTLPSEIE